MRKLFCGLLAVTVLLAGCSAGSDNSGHSAFSEEYTFTDDLDRTVTVRSHERVAALLGSFADVWQLAGGEVAAAPEDAWDDLGLALSEDTVNLGKINDLSLEMLFSASPDLVIASSNIRVDLEWLDTLESAGIPVAYFDVSDFSDYLHMLEICTDITGRKDLYKINGTDVQSQIDAVTAQSSRRVAENGAPTVLSLRASSSSVRAKNSSGSVLGEMLKALGCENIADSEDSLLENLSIEYIIKADLDYIFFVRIGGDIDGARRKIDEFISENPAWSGLTAVKEGRVYYMDKRLYNSKPNSRWGEAYEGLEQILSGESA